MACESCQLNELFGRLVAGVERIADALDELAFEWDEEEEDALPEPEAVA